jgi:hypothetical protein
MAQGIGPEFKPSTTKKKKKRRRRRVENRKAKIIKMSPDHERALGKLMKPSIFCS